MNLTVKNLLSTSNIENSYNNVAAHEELKAMMNRGERLQFYFTIDRFGCEAVRVESKTTKGFNYQLSQEGFDFLMNYMMKGETEDVSVNPTETIKAENEEADEYRREMMKLFIENNIGHLQFTPEFRDRSGRLTATATFRNGTILFFTNRDVATVEYLREKGLVK